MRGSEIKKAVPFPIQPFFVCCAQDKTRTCTAWGHYPLKVACLPISPPGHKSVKDLGLQKYNNF